MWPNASLSSRLSCCMAPTPIQFVVHTTPGAPPTAAAALLQYTMSSTEGLNTGILTTNQFNDSGHHDEIRRLLARKRRRTQVSPLFRFVSTLLVHR